MLVVERQYDWNMDGGFDPVAAVADVSATQLPTLSAEEALEQADVARKLAAFALAVEAQALVRLAEAYPGVPADAGVEGRRRAGVDEVQAAFGWSFPATMKRAVLAEQVAELPALVAELREGRVDVPRALLFVSKVAVLEEVEQRRAVCAVVLAAHARVAGGLTTRQWALLTTRTIAAIDPEAIRRREQATRADRQVRLYPPAAPGDPAALVINGPADQAAAADAAIDALARAWQEHGRPGTLDRLRHDAAIALLTGVLPDDQPTAGVAGEDEPADDGGSDSGDEAPREDPDGHGADTAEAGSATPGRCACDRPLPPAAPVVRTVVNVSMSLATLLGLEDGPCEMDRAGAISPDVARALAAQAPVWQRILTDPVDGHVVTQEIKAYRPSEAMRRFVLTRAGGVCASRGCGHRSRLQLDHVLRYPEGPTTAANLAPFDQRHHENKTSGGWAHRLDAETGAVTQTTPLGVQHTTRPLPPPGAVAVVADPPACPSCSAILCPGCGAPDCPDGVPEARRTPGCTGCAPSLHAGDRPNGWTISDEATFIRMTRELIAATDYDLIDRINVEELAELNGTDPPADTGDDAHDT